jgi:hypothetical protein
MSLCLLSRGLQNCRLSKCGFCFHLSKVMIALLFDSALLQSIRSTSQPKQQKTPWRQLPSSPGLAAEHSNCQATRCGSNNPSTEDSYVHYLRQTVEASKEHCLSSSNLPVHSPNTVPAGRLCLVCDAHCFTSCVVCDQDFCSTHLYACPECDNQYCSRCFEDHRADGHWSDSDTAAELSRGWRNNSASDLSVESLAFSTPNETQCSRSSKAVCQPSAAPSHGSSDTRESKIFQSHPREWQASSRGARRSETSPPRARRSQPSQPHAHRSENSQASPLHSLSTFTSLIVFLLQSIRQDLSSSADCIAMSLLAQSEIPREVSR